MKLMPRFVLAAVTMGACVVAVAQPYGDADRERRERNREEVMAKHEQMQNQHERTQHRNGDTRSEVRQDTHEAASTVRHKTHKAAKATRKFTHRQLEHVRNFGERQQERFDDNRPEVKSSDKTPQSMGGPRMKR